MGPSLGAKETILFHDWSTDAWIEAPLDIRNKGATSSTGPMLPPAVPRSSHPYCPNDIHGAIITSTPLGDGNCRITWLCCTGEYELIVPCEMARIIMDNPEARPETAEHPRECPGEGRSRGPIGPPPEPGDDPYDDDPETHWVAMIGTPQIGLCSVTFYYDVMNHCMRVETRCGDLCTAVVVCFTDGSVEYVPCF